MREGSPTVRLLVATGCECEDENGESLDECTGRCLPALVQKEHEQLEAEIERLRTQLSACTHVIVKLDIDHAALDVCGCEQCDEVRRGLVEAGYLERREAEE